MAEILEQGLTSQYAQQGGFLLQSDDKMSAAIKQCSTCYCSKPLTDFHKNCATRDKLHTSCKSCRCSYVALTADNDYRRVKARQHYMFSRCHDKAKRVALRLLKDIEAHMAGPEADLILDAPSQPLKEILLEFVPNESVSAIAQMLQAHLGADAYWTGFGIRWTIACIHTPPISAWAYKDNLAAYIRRLIAPQNLQFKPMSRQTKI